MSKEKDSNLENQSEQNLMQPPRGRERVVKYNSILGATCAFGAIFGGSILEGVVSVVTGEPLVGKLAFFPGAFAGFLVPIAFYNREHHRSWKQTWQDWTTW